MRFEYNSQMTMEILLRVGWLVGARPNTKGPRTKRAPVKKTIFQGHDLAFQHQKQYNDDRRIVL